MSSSTGSTKPLVIGWYMSEKKIVQLKWKEFVSFAESNGHKAIQLDLTNDCDASLYPDMNIILLKMTDELVKAPKDAAAAAIVSNARKFIAAHPQAVLVDPLGSQELTISRESMHDFFEKVNMLPKELKVRCPLGIAIRTPEDVSTFSSDFRFPCMVKSMQASGSLDAHDMAVVWSKDDFAEFKFPLYVQEYVNHDGTIFKVYVLGPDSHIVTRVSLPNLPLEYHKPINFNSQHWKHELPPELTKGYSGKRKAPSLQVINDIAQHISQILGLTLFGFDVIENVDTGELAIIDVNYFPDYRGVDGIFHKLLDHLLRKYQEQYPSQ